MEITRLFGVTLKEPKERPMDRMGKARSTDRAFRRQAFRRQASREQGFRARATPERRSFPALFLSATLGIFTGCSANWYHRSADEEVYEILKHQRKAVSGTGGAFQVEQAALPLESVGKIKETEDLKRSPAPQPVNTPVSAGPAQSDDKNGEQSREKKPESPSSPSAPLPTSPAPPSPPAPGPQEGSAPHQGTSLPAQATGEKADKETIPTVPTRLLTLKESLKLAFANNREYQTQKETVYLSALSLTLAYHQFAPRFLGIITGDWLNEGGSESGSIATRFGWDLLLVNGARLSINLLNN